MTLQPLPTDKRLGRIAAARFGFGGYQDAHIGLWLTFEGPGWGVCGGVDGFWAPFMKHDEYCKWSEADREQAYVALVRRVGELLREAKVSDVSGLVGKPVELTINDGRLLTDWRILTEVL